VPNGFDIGSHNTEAGSSSATEAGPSPGSEAESSSVSALAEDYNVVDPYELEWRDMYLPAPEVVM